MLYLYDLFRLPHSPPTRLSPNPASASRLRGLGWKLNWVAVGLPRSSSFVSFDAPRFVAPAQPTMLLLHQAGSVKIGEVVRYTVTYTPSSDRILPSPEFLFLRIRNTSAIALRAAFVHGPYTLSVAAYPSNFSPNKKFENPRRYGVPEFEPMLKAGAVWNCHLVVPDNIRQTAGEGSSKHGHFGNGPDSEGESVAWIIEVASQVIFSTSAAVHYEVLLARDEKSLNLGSVVPGLGGQGQAPKPGRVSDFQQSIGGQKEHAAQLRGVYSRAIHLKVEDTATLWNTPQLPGWDEGVLHRAKHHGADAPVEAVVGSGKAEDQTPPKRQKKVHLVVLTHGLHSNLGADMLFLKESIDAGVRQAKIDAKARKARERAARSKPSSTKGKSTDLDAESGGVESGQGQDAAQEAADNPEEEDDDEEVIVRGFSGNATKTEKGIKYLGKRLARFILSMTYPDQPFLPTTVAAAVGSKTSLQNQDDEDKRAHKNSTILHAEPVDTKKRPYKITKISFIAHSLGGLVQMYAIAYIQNHSPKFFDLIEPINFITMASPFLGLNHENPLYVKFALDFGLVGRTGQDLGLTWRAPTIARSGWGALVGNLGENAHRRVYGETQPESKPLLRILPTGPAHKALKKFRNRTVYSNVVNDGIVPLRTSCLLFLDWQGLGRVEKARREGGLVEAVVGFGWAELTGANVTSPRIGPWSPVEIKVQQDEGHATDTADSTGKTTPTRPGDAREVPQPPTNATLEDDRQSLRSVTSPSSELHGLQFSSNTSNSNPFTGFFNFFRSDPPKTPPSPSPKQNKIYQRSQTLKMDSLSVSNSAASLRSKVTTGHELSDDPEGMLAPPRTTFFESAGDLLNPKLPSVEYLIDPSRRARTIFHDRIYHPSDIPPLALKKRPSGSFTLRRKSYTRTNSSPRPANGDNGKQTSDTTVSSPIVSPNAPQQEDATMSPRDYDDTAHTNPDKDPSEVIDSSQMKVEEKIARAYHRDLSWRKVLVQLEPDAHNNMIVRRMFANAFGWPVVNHLVEAHFSDSAAARTRDEDEPNTERAKKLSEPPDHRGIETRKTDPAEQGDDGAQDVKSPTKAKPVASENNNHYEALDAVPDLAPSGGHADENALGLFPTSTPRSSSSSRPPIDRLDSVTWSERDWADSGDDSDEDSPVTRGRESKKQPPPLEAAKGKDKEVTRSASPLNWNWTEKIVGKGALQRPRSARSSTGTATPGLGGSFPSDVGGSGGGDGGGSSVVNNAAGSES
ncbi:putative serine esterase-domain-containing protein [Podospora didyma]|uniref:Serine esterase-domain-containing protein n=1 Tax=Podospora didyma TaxID=330526 RepID=A0AAE0P0H6_9PEZI|nr:putative serine esterase-domain-containing protein [Podospora didyma]